MELKSVVQFVVNVSKISKSDKILTLYVPVPDKMKKLS